jgi:DNA-binding NarL/FixJ family response regulator
MIPVEDPAGSGVGVLVVETDPRAARLWQGALLGAAYGVEVASTIDEARAALQGGPFAVLVVGLSSRNDALCDVLADVVRRPPRPRTIVLIDDINSTDVVHLYGRCDIVVPKPISTAVLLDLVATMLSSWRTADDLTAYCQEHQLGDTETRVLNLAVEQGLSCKCISAVLGCTESAVATHWERIFDKTATHSQREVISAVLAFKVRRE